MKYKKLFSKLAVLLVGAAFGVLLTTMSGLVKAQGPELSGPIEAQATIGTTLVYQGRLNNNGSPANNSYDFQFKLYDNPTGGIQISTTLTQTNVPVDNGVFTVYLDFGDVFNGEARYIEVGVRRNGSGKPFTILTPRQTLAPVPYALWARNSGNGGSNITEIWRLGKGCGYGSFDGIYRSCGAQTGIVGGSSRSPAYYFSAPSTPKTIKSVKFLLSHIDNNGYNGSATMAVQIHDFAGNVQESLGSVDLTTISTGTWHTLTLSGSPVIYPVISPNEYLIFYFTGTGTSGVFTIKLDAEVEVE